jgi:DMSO/TMAO reductase YedYZ molybdopterin-dependent catalytic subunit
LAALGISGIVGAARVTTAAATGRVPARRPASPGGFGPTSAITPLEEHYVVAKGLTPPAIDGGTWRLVVDGLVGNPVELSLDQLQALGPTTDARTLICISNPVVTYGAYAGTQIWTGAPLATVLDLAGGPLPDARHVLWRSADDYTESIPLDVALDPRSLLAWGMGPDGAPLPQEHGFPLRVFLPGRYGMKQPKWITRMTLSADDTDGFWQQRGWDREAVVRTWSRIDDPLAGDVVAAGKPLSVYGVAFAGERGIRGVEVSGNGGTSWAAAELEAPGSALTWVRWRVTLPAPASGPVVLLARATDGTGALQPEASEPPLPRGAAGWHEVRLIAG